MGCKASSEIRADGRAVNPAHLPPVPLDSWYAMPFQEKSDMPVTEFHERHKGHTLFSTKRIPTRKTDLDDLPGGAPAIKTNFQIGTEALYGMGYLHNTALFIEHAWRTRVPHGAPGKFEKPFFDMLLGIKVFINNALVPDSFPHEESLPQCTSTYRAPEACALWRAVPMMFVPELRGPMMERCVLYHGLAFSFMEAAVSLPNGRHEMRVEVVYGCKRENDFCTDFISRGCCTVDLTDAGRSAMVGILSEVSARLQENPPRTVELLEPSAPLCVFCGAPLAHYCTTCSAKICRSARCVWARVIGYPHGCTSHPALTQ